MVATKPPQYDAIIVGSGFGGCYVLSELRKKGFTALVLDEAADLGGVWYWNKYNGARTDSKVPLYEFSNEEIWKDWFWTEKYPGWEEIRRYFDHVESKLDLKKDVRFNSRVVSANFDGIENIWHVRTADNAAFTGRHFILCTGFAAKEYIPDIKGLDTFQGIKSHTAKWPRDGIDFRGKKVGIIGNGSSGLQVIQEVAPEVETMTVFQRSPTYALPMRQAKITEKDQDKSKYADLFALRSKTFAGIDREFSAKSALEASEQERQEHFEKIWTEGGLSYWLATYKEVIMDKDINRSAYDFWRSKVLPRIKDPKRAEVLAPKEPPYFFGTKRATLEQRYYEVYNQDNVELVDVKANPIKEVVSNGVVTQDGVLHELNILILATGFDSVTGGILAIDISASLGPDSSNQQQTLQSKWAEGTYTNLGLTTAGFPNMFFLYGPQGPTSFCNGPTCAEIQGDWIVNSIAFMREHGYTRLDSKEDAEKAWREQVNFIGNHTLLPQTASEYMGTNIPGKPKEMLNFLGGLPLYIQQINNQLENHFPAFVLE